MVIDTTASASLEEEDYNSELAFCIERILDSCFCKRQRFMIGLFRGSGWGFICLLMKYRSRIYGNLHPLELLDSLRKVDPLAKLLGW